MKSLDAKLSIPMDMATEFMTQIAKLEGYQQEEAAGMAKQQVNGLAAMGQMFRITTVQDNTIGSSLQYANGQVTLNGQKCRWMSLSACLVCQHFPHQMPRPFRSRNFHLRDVRHSPIKRFIGLFTSGALLLRHQSGG